MKSYDKKLENAVLAPKSPRLSNGSQKVLKQALQKLQKSKNMIEKKTKIQLALNKLSKRAALAGIKKRRDDFIKNIARLGLLK